MVISYRVVFVEPFFCLILKLQNVFTEITTRGEATLVTTIACLKDINKTKPPEARFRVRHFDHN